MTSTVADPSLGNSVASEETLVEGPPLQQADLSITKTGSPDPVAPGATMTYTLQVANTGPDTAAAITVTDLLPTEMTFVRALGAGWNCGHSDGTVTCTRSSLAAGAEREILITVTAPGISRIITNTASIASQVLDPNSSNCSAEITTLVGSVYRIYLPVVLR